VILASRREEVHTSFEDVTVRNVFAIEEVETVQGNLVAAARDA